MTDMQTWNGAVSGLPQPSKNALVGGAFDDDPTAQPTFAIFEGSSIQFYKQFKSSSVSGLSVL